MAKMNKVKLPSGECVPVNDERIHIYRSLTGTAAVTASPYTHAKWDVSDSTITQYVDGMVVCIKVPVAGNGTYGTALQINNLGYKPVVFNVNSMIGTRYSVGAVVWAVYNSTQTASLYVNSASASTITGCWQVMDYDSNTTSIYTLQRYNGTRVVSADLLRYVIAFRKNETTIVPIHSVAGTGTAENTAVTSTNKTMTTESFDPFGEIYQYATNTKIAANESVNLSALRTQCASVDARYIFNCNKTLTAQRELYLVVDLQSDGMVKLATSVNPWAQTLPSTNDGHLYILLGYAYSTYQFELYYYHPIYYHDGTRLRQYGGDKTFSGNYNDLTNKPTIPDAVSGVNDGTNWTSLTIGSTTKAIPSGGGSSTLSALTDTNISNPSDGQILKYNSSTQKFENANENPELPSQTGNSGKFLATDGSDASWANLPSDVFWCNFTITSSGNTYVVTCNKTLSQIEDAYNNGESVLGTFVDPVMGAIVNAPLSLSRGDTSTTYIVYFWQCFGNQYLVIIGGHYNGTDIWQYNNELLNLKDLNNVNITAPSNNDVLKYDSTVGKWVNGQVPGGSITDYDFTHTQILGTPNLVTFAAGERCSVFANVNVDTSMSIACENNSDNYIWIFNAGVSDVDITISGITQNSISISNIYMPEDGITVPAGKVCEIGVIVNSSGAFITCRNDIVLSSSI